jgi:hypothetical protein
MTKNLDIYFYLPFSNSPYILVSVMAELPDSGIFLLLLGVLLLIVSIISYFIGVAGIKSKKYMELGIVHVIITLMFLCFPFVEALRIGSLAYENYSEYLIRLALQISYSSIQLSFLTLLFLKTRKESKLESKEQ